MTEAERHQEIGKSTLELTEQRRRLDGLKSQASGLSSALKRAAQRLEDRANGRDSSQDELKCPEADDVAVTYHSMAEAAERVRAASERLKQLGVSLG
ncbi:MAG: hypothetical protein F4Y47_00805 [Acidobacteriia bacterium]|nr:hypothetical protein [Terriglobia bacterium]MYG03297.1 hypothetical protein [Terriglobia bacterium]MYK11162.1 hypothetical protein [Terriglobia bacterium]